MKLYLAPMEGLTGFIFRSTYHNYYEPFDRYYTPFITSIGLSHRELNDVLPEHNEGMNVVPQILTKKASDFVIIAKKMKEFGYTEVNLNLGCPSGTVIKKGRGAGMLAEPRVLDGFLAEIFEKSPLPISVKTRLGMDDDDEWAAIQEIYEKYPICELIVHPRVQKDFYKRNVRMQVFDETEKSCSLPLCYNGDIHSTESYESFRASHPETAAVMLGRGALINPELAGRIRKIEASGAGTEAVCAGESAAVTENVPDGAEKISAGTGKVPAAVGRVSVGAGAGAGRVSVGTGAEKESEAAGIADIERLREFHAELLARYSEEMSGDRNTLFKMKEFWFYLGQSFPDEKKALKTIKKTQNMMEYKAAVNSILRA